MNNAQLIISSYPKKMVVNTGVLTMNKTILDETKLHHPNFLMMWFDCKKAFDSVPRNGILKVLELAHVPMKTINPFVPNASFLYPLKTSENLTVFWCFQGMKKGWIRNEWVNTIKDFNEYMGYQIIPKFHRNWSHQISEVLHKKRIDAEYFNKERKTKLHDKNKLISCNIFATPVIIPEFGALNRTIEEIRNNEINTRKLLTPTRHW